MKQDENRVPADNTANGPQHRSEASAAAEDDILRSFSTLFSASDSHADAEKAATIANNSKHSLSHDEFDTLKKQFAEQDEEAKKHLLGEREMSSIREALDHEAAPAVEIPVISGTDTEPIVPISFPPMGKKKADRTTEEQFPPNFFGKAEVDLSVSNGRKSPEKPLILIPENTPETEADLTPDELFRLQEKINADIQHKAVRDEKRFQGAEAFSAIMADVPAFSTDRAISLGGETVNEGNQNVKLTKKQKGHRLISLLIAAVLVGSVAFGTAGICVFRGPSDLFRDKAVKKAQQSAVTRWIPDLFLNDKTVDRILTGQDAGGN